MTLPDPFLIRAGLAGLGVAAMAGPLGCFVVWRRMAYFSDAMAHASVLGVALSLLTALPLSAGVYLAALGAAALVWRLSHGPQNSDSMLGVVSHSALATGLVAVSLAGTVRVDLMAYLFGDILAVTDGEIALIWLGGGAVLALLAWRWSALLTATLSDELAHAAGLHPRREAALLTLMLAVVIGAAIKVVGALLIGSLLLIPAAAARPLSRTPEAMAAIAAGIGAAATIGGLAAAWHLDSPAGPTIVCAAAALFAAARVASTLRL